MYYSFRKDKSVGELGERIVVEDLLSCGFKFINDNKNNRYDIKMMNKDGKLQIILLRITHIIKKFGI